MSITVVEEKAEKKVPLAGELLYCGATEWDVIGRRKTGVLTENLVSPTGLRSLVGIDIRFVASGCSRWGFGGYGRLGHREQKDEWAPRIVEAFQRQNVLPPDAVISAGNANSACTAVSTQKAEAHCHKLDVYDGDVPAIEGIEKDNGKGNRKKGSNDALANSSQGKKSEKSDSNSDGYEFEETSENAGNGLMRNKKGQVGRKTSGRGRGSRPNMSLPTKSDGSTTKSGTRGRTRN